MTDVVMGFSGKESLGQDCQGGEVLIFSVSSPLSVFMGSQPLFPDTHTLPTESPGLSTDVWDSPALVVPSLVCPNGYHPFSSLLHS